MSEKIFNFNVPVSGRETFSVVASSYEEALEKINRDDYYIRPEVSDIEWDFGLCQEASQYLPRCYTIEKIQEPTHD
jgi:hypothetical protein